jgi:hypothetical protein
MSSQKPDPQSVVTPETTEGQLWAPNVAKKERCAKALSTSVLRVLHLLINISPAKMSSRSLLSG